MLVSELLTNENYQHKLRRDFTRRKVHPAIESMLWSYHLGKPAQPIEMSGGLALDVNARIAEERRVFAQLDITDLEQLAAESQALVNRAFALAKVAEGGHATPQDIVVEAKPENPPSESLAITPESNNGSYVNQAIIPHSKPITPSDTEG